MLPFYDSICQLPLYYHCSHVSDEETTAWGVQRRQQTPLGRGWEKTLFQLLGLSDNNLSSNSGIEQAFAHRNGGVCLCSSLRRKSARLLYFLLLPQQIYSKCGGLKPHKLIFLPSYPSEFWWGQLGLCLECAEAEIKGTTGLYVPL